MQGVHAFDPKAKASIDLESFVAEDHFLRRIDRVLDLSFIRELTAARYADGQGRPSIDPEVYFRMQLVAYFNGITKDRRLCEEVHYNLAYRWFCRLSLDDDVPDHSSLTRIRDRLGEEVFEAVFRRIVAQCQQKGLVKDPCRVMTDATLIAADASLNSLVHNDPEQAQTGRRGPATSDEERSMVRHNASCRTRRTAAAPTPTPRWPKSRERPRQLKYKVHQTIDADSRVILDTEVTTGARHDNQPYLEQLQRVERSVPDHDPRSDRRSRLWLGGNHSQRCKSKAVKTYIPLWIGRVWQRQVPEVGVSLRAGTRSHSLSGGEVPDAQSGRSTGNHKRYVSLCRTTVVIARWRRLVRQSERPSTSHTRDSCFGRLDQDLFEEVQAQMNEPTFGERASRADVEVRGAVRRGEAIPLPRASEVSRAVQSADPGLPHARSCRTSSACSSHFIAGC